MAYVSNESGRPEVYVAPFSGAGGRWQVSAEGGQAPRWRSDGKELFYVTPQGALMAVPVEPSGEEFRRGAATLLFNAGLRGGIPRYGVTADGTRILAAVPVGDPGTASRMALVMNWPALR